MTELTENQLDLSRAWKAVYIGAGKAINWVNEVAPHASEVGSVAERLQRDLYRARNLARSLKRVSITPMGIGFFGLSQAGKSYLISALAADASGRLETQLGPRKLDFIEHVNPVGGGKEATGLVTRFTRRANPSPESAFPVELRLFREMEIAIILANAWFEDFDHDRLVNSTVTEASVLAVLEPLRNRINSETIPGFSADDVVALWDYIEHKYSAKTHILNSTQYWAEAIKLVPNLSVQERGQFFSILWGRVPQITDTFVQLASVLHRLGLADTVYAPISSLVSEGKDGKLVKTNSIMNVDILSRLGQSGNTILQVRPSVDGNLGALTDVQPAEIAALTSELIFRLTNDPSNNIVNSVDLLDFPGYRSRQKYLDIQEAADSSDSNPVAKLLLRGKVAYLFERYTREQEMNALVMCTSTDKQSEVVGVGPVLKTWIDLTQGDSPQKRAVRPAGLIWALTMCDIFVTRALDNPAQYSGACSNMLKLTMIERFGNEEWMGEWSTGQPFNNTYLVRKPRIENTFIQLDTNKDEIGLQTQKQDALEALGKMFISDELSKRHVKEIDEAWLAMLKLNDGGIGRFSDYFKSVDINVKLNRIREQLDEFSAQLLPRLEVFYEAGGEGELDKKKVLANFIIQPFVVTANGKYVIGELLAYMCMPAQVLRDLYLSGNFEASPEKKALPEEISLEKKGFIDIWEKLNEVIAAPAMPDSGTDSSSLTQSLDVPELQTHEHLFARAAFDAWATHLRGIPQREGLLAMLKLPKDAVSALVNELIVCAERLELPLQLANTLLKRAQTGVRRDDLVERQVLISCLLLDDFSAWFGYLQLPESDRPTGLLGRRQSLFSFLKPEVPAMLPLLPGQAVDHSAIFADDWISGVAICTKENTGHRKGREITPEQNEALGKVLAAFHMGAEQEAYS